MTWDGPGCDLQIRVLDDVAMQLVGNSTQVIDLPSLGSFQSLTIEFWILPNEISSLDGFVLQPMETVTGAVGVSVLDSRISVHVDGVDTITFGQKINWGVWTHVALTFETSRRLLRFYLNGEKVDQKELLLSSVSLVTNRLGGTPQTPFKGFVKELRFWHSLRSSLEVSMTMNAALTGTEQGLEALYPLSGPLSANTIYIDDVAGGHGVRIIGGIWARTPTAPPGPRELPPVYHNAMP